MTKPTEIREGSFISFDKTPIYYEDRNYGTPIVFVYGLACLINHWHFQIEHFSSVARPIAFDIRGHHKSGLPDDPKNISIEASAHDISYLLRHLGIRKAHFVGHSLGAQNLLKTFDLYPEIFKSITFINGFAKNPIKGMFGLDIIEPLFHFIKDKSEKNINTFENLWKAAINNPLSMYGAGFLGGFNLNLTQFKDIEIYTQGVSNIPLSVFLKLFEDMMSFEGEPIASKIRIPTLIISGENDKVTPRHFQTHLHELIQTSQFVEIPYGSHCTQLDFPELINLKLEKFINSVEG